MDVASPVLVEWAPADAAMGLSSFHVASFTPEIWTEPMPLEKAIEQLEKLSAEDPSRPLLLKLPAGQFTPEQRFAGPADALGKLRKARDRPAFLERSSCGGEGTDGMDAEPRLTAEWMFTDAALGMLGFQAMARFNPMCWSGHLDLLEAKAQLEQLGAKDRLRPVTLKIPAGVFTPEKYFRNAAEAAAHLQRTDQRFRRASVSWAVELTSFLCKRGEEHRFQCKVPLLDVETYSSVQMTVDQLNINDALCPGGLCVVYSKRVDGYVLLYRADKRSEAKRLFDLRRLMTWKDFSRRRSNKDGYVLGDITRGFLGRLAFLGDIWAPQQGRFDGKRLVMLSSGALGDRYERLRELGTGVQGTASLLRRRCTGQEYVAKEASAGCQDGLEDMKAELEKMLVLRHPHCAKIVEFMEVKSGGSAITICEFAHCGDLAQYMVSGKMLDSVVPSIFKQAVAGVAFLHASGCVHNDLKPENMLVYRRQGEGAAPRVAITDYGCARFLFNDHRLKFGDPRYMAPENFRTMLEYITSTDASMNVDLQPAGDVWSLGVTLYELLSKGIIPFLYEPCTLQRMQDEDGMFERLQEGIISSDEVELSQHCPGAPSSMAALLTALLRKDEYLRPEAAEVLAHLKVQEPAPSSKRRVELSVQQHQACQILLNCMMWRLQSQHVDQLCSVFESFNVSNSGRLSREEFRAAVESFSQNASRIDDMFDMADIDGDGSLEFNEFAAIGFDWGSMDEETLDKHIQELLEDLSADSSGAVTELEFAAFFRKAIDRAELTKLFLRIDESNTGRVSAQNLRHFLQHNRASALPAVACEVPAP